MSTPKKAKMVIVGDGMIGKTCLVERFSKEGDAANMQEDTYNPTTFEDRSLPVVIDEATGDFEFYDNTLHIEDDQFVLEIWDTAGQEAMESLRTLAYPNTHVFLVGFSMDKMATLENVESEWQRELNEQASTCDISKNAPRILIGTKCDLRDQALADGQECVSYEQAYEVAKRIGCVAFIETSAVTKKNCHELQKLVLLAGVSHAAKEPCPIKLEDYAPTPAPPNPATVFAQIVQRSKPQTQTTKAQSPGGSDDSCCILL